MNTCQANLSSKTDILSHFLNKFHVETRLSPIYRAMDVVCVLNYPTFFAHQPFKFQVQGTPFETHEEAEAYRRVKIEWALNAMQGWDAADRAVIMRSSGVVGDVFKTLVNYDAHVLYYFDDLKLALAEYLAPALLPDVPNLDFINDIEQSIAQTHAKVMRYFDQQILLEAVVEHSPSVCAKKLCNDTQEHIHLTHDWVLGMFDYCETKTAVDRDTLLLRDWLKEAEMHAEELEQDVFYKGRLPEAVQLSGAFFSEPMISMARRETNVKKLKEWRKKALAENKGRIDIIIGLYQEGKIANYATADNLVERLASKAKDKRVVEKTDREFSKVVEKYKDADSAKGKLTRDLAKRTAEENVTVTVILFREKESDPKAEKKKSERVTRQDRLC